MSQLTKILSRSRSRESKHDGTHEVDGADAHPYAAEGERGVRKSSRSRSREGERLATYGRGGAGNLHPPSPSLRPTDLETPHLSTTATYYTTGRGGTGNMAPNTSAADARRAQDVELSPALIKRLEEEENSKTPVHVGRGGAANWTNLTPVSTRDEGVPLGPRRTNSDGPRDKSSLDKEVKPEEVKEASVAPEAQPAGPSTTTKKVKKEKKEEEHVGLAEKGKNWLFNLAGIKKGN